MMNLAKIIDRFATETGRTKGESREIILSFLDLIVDCLVEGKRINLYGFGSFDTYELSSQKKFKPTTGEYYMTKPRRAVRFKAGDTFLNAINSVPG